MDNEYINGYAKYFGPVGTSVYLSLCRHADNETQRCFPAMKLIAEEIGASENTVIKYIKLFEKYHLISIEREKDPRTNRQLNNVYTLLDKEEWIKPDYVAWKTSRPQRLESESRPQPLGNKDTHREGDSSKETHSASPPGDALRSRSVQEYFTLAYKQRFGREPAINFAKDLAVVKQRLPLFKSFDEIKALIDAYLDSEYAKRVGYSLSICFAAHTINSWQARELTPPLQAIFTTKKA